jgi:hypothetical protein
MLEVIVANRNKIMESCAMPLAIKGTFIICKISTRNGHIVDKHKILTKIVRIYPVEGMDNLNFCAENKSLYHSNLMREEKGKKLKEKRKKLNFKRKII